MSIYVPRGQTPGQYLDQLIGVLASQVTSEEFIKQAVTLWVTRARLFMPYDKMKAFIVTALVSKGISFDTAAVLAATVLDKFDGAQVEKARCSAGTYAH